MAQGNLKGVGGGASGILSGVAAVAPAVAAIMENLSQFSPITRHDTRKTVAVNTIPGPPPVTRATVAPIVAPVVAVPSAKPSLAARAAAPHPDERRSRPKARPADVSASPRRAPPARGLQLSAPGPAPPQVALAEPPASHLGAQDRNLSHLVNPGGANTPATR